MHHCNLYVHQINDAVYVNILLPTLIMYAHGTDALRDLRTAVREWEC